MGRQPHAGSALPADANDHQRQLLGGKDAPAYKNRSIRQKVYTDIDNQLRREFGVNTYKAIKRNQTDLAISIIKEYDLPMVLKNEIEAENAQECLW